MPSASVTSAPVGRGARRDLAGHPRRQREHLGREHPAPLDQRGRGLLGGGRCSGPSPGYSLVGAAVIVTSGSLGDVDGRKKVFLAGLFLFIGCACCSRCPAACRGDRRADDPGSRRADPARLWAEPAVGAHTGQAQLRAVSIWGGASAVGAAAGPLVGGLLVDTTGWQGLFWLDAAIAVVCVFIGRGHHHRVARPERVRAPSTSPARCSSRACWCRSCSVSARPATGAGVACVPGLHGGLPWPVFCSGRGRAPRHRTAARASACCAT